MRSHARFIVFVFLISSSNSSPRSNLDRQRRDGLSDDLFTSDIEGQALPMAISSEVNTGSLADEDSLFQNDLEPFTADPSLNIAQGPPCGQPLGKRDAFDDFILSCILHFMFHGSD